MWPGMRLSRIWQSGAFPWVELLLSLERSLISFPLAYDYGLALLLLCRARARDQFAGVEPAKRSRRAVISEPATAP